MPFSLNTRCKAKITLAGPGTSSASTNTTYQFPEFPATGIMRCVASSDGKTGALTFQGTQVLIDLPTASNLHLTTTPYDTETAWAPRKQVLTNYWVIPVKGTAAGNNGLVLTNTDNNAQGFFIKATTASGANNIVTVEVVGSIVSYDSANAPKNGSFTGTFTVLDKSAGTTFATKWSVIQPPMFQTNSGIIMPAVPISIALQPAGSNGLSCQVVPTLAVNFSSNVAVSAVLRVTTSAVASDSSSLITESTPS